MPTAAAERADAHHGGAPSGGGLRVLFLHHYAPFGGASRSLLELIESLPKDDVAVAVATPAGQFADLLRARGYQVEELPGVALFDHTRYSHYRGLRWLVLARELARLPVTSSGLERVHRRWPEVDVVHVNEATMLPSVRVARRLWGRPVVLHVRSVMHRWDTWRGRLLAKFIARNVRQLIAIDENVAQSLPASLVAAVIHNGLTPPERRLVEAARPARPFTVGMVGNLLRVKGCLEFVEAARLLRRDGVKFVFYGQSVRATGGWRHWLVRVLGLSQEVEPELRELVARHRLEDVVEFRGFNTDLAAVYRSLDAVCFPSHYDAPGRPIFEAAFFGVPAIAAISVPRSDTVRPGETGTVIRPHDAPALAAAIKAYAADPELCHRHGAAARVMAESLFDARENARSVLALYHSVTRDARTC